MERDIVRYGLISTAQIALTKHLPAARGSKNSEIVAISSRGEAKARVAADQHGIPSWYGSYEELLADPDLDAVINPLPNSLHCEWTIKAAEAGKHVLCEKPLSVTVDEARRMIDSAKSNDVVLVEAFTHRWNPHMRTARRLIAEGAIGYVTGMDSSLTVSVTEPEGPTRYSKDLAGGTLMDGGCYAVYACRFALGAEPIRAAGMAYDSGGYGVETTFTGLLEFPGGAIARVSSSFEQPRRIELTVYGSEGRIIIPNMFDDSGPLIVTQGDERRVEATPAPDRFRVQLEEFSNCVLTGKQPEFPAEDGMRNMAAIVALLSAARERRVMEVEQV